MNPKVHTILLLVTTLESRIKLEVSILRKFVNKSKRKLTLKFEIWFVHKSVLIHIQQTKTESTTLTDRNLYQTMT